MDRCKGYAILEELGRGSMGVVYKARDERLDRIVALKVLNERFLDNSDALKRFDREARLAASLCRHPNIVTVYSAGNDGGSYHIAMEYVEGGSISKLLASAGAQDTRRTVEIIAQVADALAEAHERGIVHRDIKPNNILLDAAFRPKVADFGLARFLEVESDLTAENVRVGTYRYMSPEQCSFSPATARSDIYSLGVVFYEMLSGRHAFQAPNPLALVQEIVNAPFPSVLRARPTVPQDIAHVLERMVAKSPDRRYTSARDVCRDLQSWLESGAVTIQESDIPPLPPLEEEAFAQDDSEPIVDQLSETPTEMLSGLDAIVHFVESDRLWAEWIHRTLTEAGYDADLRIWDFKTSRESVRQTAGAIRQRTCFIAVVSPSYMTALLGDRTWTQAYVDNVIKALPVRVRNCAVPGLLSLHTYVDLVALEPETAKKALMDEMFKRRGKPRGTTARGPAPTLAAVSPTTLRRTIWNVPVARAPYFAGRSTYLQAIYTNLTERNGMATLVPASASREGIGLSQMAVEYAYYYEGHYSFVWWIRADKKMARRLDYATLAKAAKLDGCDGRELGALVNAVQTWLNESDNWLLIFDDATQFDEVAPYLVKGSGCHVLITSSSPSWPAETNPIPIPPLERAESVELLYQTTRQRNEGAAAALADSLGDVPLALVLASAYISADKISLDDYIDRFLELHKLLWGIENPPKDAESVVATALGMSLERLAHVSPEGLALLKVCTYLAPTDIRLARLCSAARCFPRTLAKTLQNPGKLTAAIGALQTYKLIAQEKDAFYVHRLVQRITAGWLECEKKKARTPGEARIQEAVKACRTEKNDPLMWERVALRFMRESFPTDCGSSAVLEEGSRLLCHALTAVQHAERRRVEHKTAAALWRDMGKVLCELREYVRASGALERAILLHKDAHGDNDKGLLQLHIELARIHWARSDLKKAQCELERALALSKAVHGETHIDGALIYHDIGNILAQMGDYASARRYYMNALNIDRKAGNKNGKAIARDLSSLGLATQELGDFVGAHEFYGEALEIAERVYGPKHREVSVVVKNLAALMQRMGDPGKARAYYQRAIEIDAELHGPNYPPLAQYYNNLGIISQGLGDLATASTRYRQALRINESAYGPAHPKTAINMVNLGNVLRLQDKRDEAMAMYKRAVDILAQAFGPKHHMTETAARNLQKLVRAPSQTD